MLGEPLRDAILARVNDRAVLDRASDGERVVDDERVVVDGEERVGDDGAAMIARQADGDGAAVVHPIDAGDVADRGAVLHHRIAALQSARIFEDDGDLRLAAMHEPASAEPDARGERDQKEE